MATSDRTSTPTAPPAGATTTAPRVPHQHVRDEPAFERPTVPARRRPGALAPEVPAAVATPVPAAPSAPSADATADRGRGTPLQAIAGWGSALVLGAACWAGALAVVGRFV